MSLTTTISTQTQAMEDTDQNVASVNESSAERLDSTLPPLSYRVLTDDRDKRAALHLVADSIAQQRQVAAAAIILHPVCLALLAGVCAIAYRHYEHQGYGTLMTVLSGVAISYLAIVRFFTSKYISMAEDFRWQSFITGASGDQDVVLAAIYGEEIIATLVLRWQSQVKRGNKRNYKRGSGIIRAWTTRLRYRGKGIGSDLLQFAVQQTQKKFGQEASVEFAPDHANSVHPLWDTFNGPFRKRQKRAAQALVDTLGM